MENSENTRTIIISKKQKRKLEELVYPKAVDLLLQKYDVLWDFKYYSKRTVRILREKGITIEEMDTIIKDGMKAVTLQRSRAGFLEHQLHNGLSSLREMGGNYEETIQNFEKIQAELHDFLLDTHYHNPILKEYRALLQRVQRKCEDDDKEYILGLLYRTFNFPIDWLHAFLKVKRKRVENLKEIDEQIAFSYLIFYLPFQKSGEFAEPDEKDAFLKHLYSVPKLDSDHYLNIINRFQVEKTQTPQQEESLTMPITEIPREKEISPYMTLVQTITRGYSGILGYYTMLRIKYFAEEVVTLLPQDKLEKLQESFAKFKFVKKMKNRQTALSELRARNFFDDIELNYIIKRRTPSATDLELMYKRVLHENNS